MCASHTSPVSTHKENHHCLNLLTCDMLTWSLAKSKMSSDCMAEYPKPTHDLYLLENSITAFLWRLLITDRSDVFLRPDRSSFWRKSSDEQQLTVSVDLPESSHQTAQFNSGRVMWVNVLTRDTEASQETRVHLLCFDASTLDEEVGAAKLSCGLT